MPSSVKRAVLCAVLLLMVLGSCLNAQAASQRVVVKMNGNSPIGLVLNVLGGTVLDAISESNLYLLQVPTLPLLNSFTLNLLGIAYIEADTTVSGPTLSTFGLLDTKSAADWYRMQPALTRIRADR